MYLMPWALELVEKGEAGLSSWIWGKAIRTQSTVLWLRQGIGSWKDGLSTFGNVRQIPKDCEQSISVTFVYVVLGRRWALLLWQTLATAWKLLLLYSAASEYISTSQLQRPERQPLQNSVKLGFGGYVQSVPKYASQDSTLVW